MIKLYHAPNTRSIRILWLLQELKACYDFEYELERVEFIPPSKGFFAQCTPSGKIPFLSDNDNGLSESGAIIQYLLERYDTKHYFSPPIQSDDRAPFLQWLHYAEGTLSTPLSTLLWHQVYKQDADSIPTVIADAKDRAERSLSVIDKALQDNSYLVNNTFTAADIMMGYTLWSARYLGALGERFGALINYLQILEARPAFQQAWALK